MRTGLPFYFFVVFTFYNDNGLQIFERTTRKAVIFTLGLVKRSGHPEQSSKTPQKYDLIRKFWSFLGHLERFGENWIGIWIKCQRLQRLVY